VHIGVHSFTPRLDGVVRQTDVGLLYDPQRASERTWCHVFKDAFGPFNTQWRLRFNYPYRGSADGFTTYLRHCFSAQRYVGIELEVNQGIIAHGSAWRGLSLALLQTFRALVPPG
jgi:predicted N-formylglutamate amidohydrolase